MAWIPVVDKLKEALRVVNWAAADTQIKLLSKMDHPRDIFQNLTINGIPALQRFACFIPRRTDIDRMNHVVKTLTESGYDINQKADFASIPMCVSFKLTALLTAIAAGNYHLVRIFLRHGARTDVRDARGYDALHWAVYRGCRDIFDLLLDFGASVTSSAGERNGEEGRAHPLLHTAVDTGCVRMVSFLLQKGIFDVNEKAVYRGEAPWTTTQTFTPLGRALRLFDTNVFWILLNQSGIRAEMEDIEYCLVKGNAKLATTLMGHLPDLCWVTIDGGEDGVQERVPSLLWLLHKINSGLSLPEINEPQVHFLPALASVMKEFVENGYDLNQTWNAILEAPPIGREPLLHYALRLDLIGRTNLLLRTLLELDHLSFTTGEGRKCLEYLLRTMTDYCCESDGPRCWRAGPVAERVTCCVDDVKLLLRHGFNASGVVIWKEFKFHFGYTPMLQMLYRNGARIAGAYFSDGTICTYGGPLWEEMEIELRGLLQWTQEFDQGNPISLKNICRLRVRKMLARREDLKMLEGLPVELKESVLNNDFV